MKVRLHVPALNFEKLLRMITLQPCPSTFCTVPFTFLEALTCFIFSFFQHARVLSFRFSDMASQLSQQYACQYLSQNTCGLEQARVVNLPLRAENGHYVLFEHSDRSPVVEESI